MVKLAPFAYPLLPPPRHTTDSVLQFVTVSRLGDYFTRKHIQIGYYASLCKGRSTCKWRRCFIFAMFGNMQQFDDCDYFPHKHSELCWKQINCTGSYLMVYSICESRDSIFSSKHVRIAIDRSTAPIVHSTDKVTSLCEYDSSETFLMFGNPLGILRKLVYQ